VTVTGTEGDWMLAVAAAQAEAAALGGLALRRLSPSSTCLRGEEETPRVRPVDRPKAASTG